MNLFSVTIILATFFYKIAPSFFTRAGRFTAKTEDIWGMAILFSMMGIYCVNFFYGVKLVARFHKGLDSFTFSNKARIFFFILEIISTILYSLGIYAVTSTFRLARFGELKGFELFIFTLMVLCLYGGYLSSLFRILLTRYVLKQTKLRIRSDIDLISEA